MSDYTQVTDFSAKDGLTTGDPEKAVSGADVDGEFSAISTAIASKVDEPGSPATNDFMAWSGSAWAKVSPATQANMEAATDATVPVVPSVVQNHPGVAKAWAYFPADEADGAPSAVTSYNVTSVNKDSTGDYTVTWATDFSSANYAVVVTQTDASAALICRVVTQTAGAITIKVKDDAGTNDANPEFLHVVAFGDQ